MSKASVTCPNCSASLLVPTDVLGRKIKCPKCQEVVRLPLPSEIAPAAVRGPSTPEPPANSPVTTPTNPSAASAPAVSPPSPSPTPTTSDKPAEPVMAKPLVPMATVLPPDAMPVISKNQPKPTPAPAASATPKVDEPHGSKETPPSFSGLDSKVAAEKPRVKIKRKHSNPWPIILLGVGALAVLALIVTLLILFLPTSLNDGGPSIPEIQFVNDATTEVGKSVRIPISVTYPSSYKAADKARWTFQVAPENPAGSAWDAATGFLTWAPGTQDAGKSHALAIIIQDSSTRETNRGTFQVHVPALSPGIMATMAYLGQNNMVFTASLPKAHEGMKHQETVPNLFELQIGNDRVDLYDYSSVEIATAKLAEIDESKLDELGLTASLSAPLSYVQSGGAILVTPTASLEASPSIKKWFEAAAPQ